MTDTWLWLWPPIPLIGDLLGQGDEASIGTANMQRATFERTRDNTTNGPRPELEGRDWRDLIDDPRLSIAAMAYHMKDLQDALPPRLSNTPYSRQELVRYGYRTNAQFMRQIASGTPMGPESTHLNNQFLGQYARAGRWLYYYENRPQARSRGGGRF